MMDEFIKMLEKKMKEQGGPKKGPGMHAKACASKACSDVLGGDLLENGIKKVTVASDSEEGLEEGLKKAEDVLKSKKSSKDMESEEEEESEEGESEEYPESENSEDLKSEIAKLKQEIEDLKKRA